VFAGHAPASTSSGADVGNAVAPSDTGAVPADPPPSVSTDDPVADAAPAQAPATGSGSSGTSSSASSRSVIRHTTGSTAVSAPSTPVVRAPVTAPVSAPVIHHSHSRSGGS